MRRAAAHLARTGIGALLMLVMSGCTDWAGYDLDKFWGNFPVLSTMRGSVAYEGYELPRLPPPGAVPVSSPIGEMLPPFIQAQLDSVGAVLTNPVPASAEVLARGEVVYLRHCAACHGAQGEGTGPVVGPGRFPIGNPLRDGLALDRSDGYIYGVIRVGRGLMPAYAERVTHDDRWAVVHYVRQLQGRTGGASAQPVAPVQPAAPAAQPLAPGQPAGPAAPVTQPPAGGAPQDTAAVP